MERAPFPDVTGLRLRAPSRAAFAADPHSVASLGRASLSTSLTLRHVQTQAQSSFHTSASAVIAAAWGTVLYMYLQHECELVAFDGVRGQDTVSIPVGPTMCDMRNPLSLVEHINCAWSGAPTNITGPTLFFDALHDPESAAFARVETVLRAHPEVTLACIAYVNADGLITLSLLASPSVHVHGSAKTQLEQMCEALWAILEHRDPMTMPLHLTSLANPHPQPMSTDMPKGMAGERLEDQFLRRAQDIPHVPALTCCTSVSPPTFVSWSYQELDTRSNEIAQLLWSCGVGYAAAQSDDDQVIVLCMAKCMDMYAAILGVLKAGATWCPIDPGWPSSRQSALLIKSGARVALTTGAEAPMVESSCPEHIQVVRLDRPFPSLTSLPPRTAERSSASHLAYKIWTSGTTGLPKAVGVEHIAAVQGMRALQKAVPTDMDAPVRPSAIRYLQFAAYVFDLSIFDIFYAWGHGGTVCFAPLDLLLTRLVDVANALQVTHTLLTPAVSAMVPRRAIPTMQVMINGGEKLSQVVADEWTQEGCRVVNIYGPAEATLSLTMREIPPHGDQVKAHNIGLPFDDALCVLMNEHNDVVPRGCIGELLLGGPQLARGYIGDEAKTREKFVQHPTLGRLYHTGDLARQLWDGQFEYLGRNDDQVKINGVRIELLEINAAVKAASELVWDADTVALPGPDPAEPPRIVAFAVYPWDKGDTNAPLLRTDPDAVALARTLRSGAQALLPSYMVPFHFVVLSAFPRTSSAKIDRRAVRAAYDSLDLHSWEARLADVHEAEGVEEAMAHPLAQKVCEWLPLMACVSSASITPHASFPMLGINSVRAMALSAKLVEAGFGVSAADVARHDSIFKLVRAYTKRPHTDPKVSRDAWLLAWQQAYSSPETQCGEVLPTTPLQQGMLLETQMDASRYWLYRVVVAHEPVVYEQLVAALEQVVMDLDCLRMGFVRTTPPSDSIFAPLYMCVLQKSVSVKVRRFQGQDVVSALASHVPNVADGRPPWLAAFDATTRRFVLVMHHALYDATTLDMIFARMDAHIASVPLSETHAWSEALEDLVPAPQAEQATLDAWAHALRPMDHVAWTALHETRIKPQRRLEHYERSVSSVSWSALEETAAHIGTSVRPLAHVAWARVLGIILGTPNVLLGDVVSLRGRRASYATTGGPLLATLPVCVNAASQSAVSDHVQQLHASNLALQEHASVPLSYIRQQVHCPRDQPLFVSLFVLEMDEDHDERPTEHALAWHTPTDLGVSVEHALALEMRVTRKGHVRLVLNYLDSAMSSSYAEMLLHMMDTVLGAYTHDVSMPVAHNPPDVPASLLARPDMPPPTHPTYLNVGQWPAHHARIQPSACAIEYRDNAPASHTMRATYADLDKASARLAAYLVLAVPPHAVVGVALPRSIETYTCLLGILRAGLVYLPLDESLPHARREHLLRDSAASLVLTRETSLPWPCACKTPEEALRDEASALPSVSADDAAYVLYTSGSTGEPKGCIVSHANLSHALDNFRDALGSDSLVQARFLARSAEAFDVHLLECLLAWQMGATVVTMPRRALLADIGTAMADSQVTHACVVPSLFFTQGRRVAPSDVPHLRALIVGGEKLADDLVDVWGPASIPVLNAYGPTEATIGISCTPVRVDSLAADIGVAFAGNAFFVRAHNGGLAWRGQPGELCILGTHVGRGYVRRSSNAFFTWDGQRAYATGDLARMMPCGRIEYLGRVNQSQVKVRGARVELGEIDAALRQAGASHAATLLLTHPQLDTPHLVAFVAKDARATDEVPHATDDDTTLLMSHLRHHLSTYMVPSVMVPLSFLPLARVSGKMDHRALRSLYAAMPRDALVDHTPPRTPMECAAARAVQRVLRLDAIGMHTDLFGVGLDSLAAVKLAQALEDEGVAGISISSLMTEPTLAGFLRCQHAEVGEVEASQAPLPLQCATLAQSLASPAQRLYVHHVRLHLTPDADRQQVLRQWRDALAHYAIYRTVFHTDPRLTMDVLGSLPTIESVVDGCCTQEACDQVADDILARVESCPPVRLVLYDDVLCLSMHHALYDAASLDLLIDAVRGERAPDTFDDVVRLASRTAPMNAKHYTDVLQGMIRTPMPNLTGRYAAAAPTKTHVHTMKRVSLRDLHAHARTQKSTLQALVLHTFASLLAAYAGEDEATLGVVLSGRMADPRHARAHGPCITTVPFRWQARHGDVHAVHAQLVSALHHQFVHLTEVAHALGMDTSLFDVLFSFMPAPSAPKALPPGIGALDSNMANDFVYALQVTADEARDTLVLEATFAPDRMPYEHADLFARQLEDSLRLLLEGGACEASLCAAVYPKPLEPDVSDTLLARFARHAQDTPDATALTFASSIEPYEATVLSYRELDTLSSRYAAHLAASQDPAVYVHLPRCIDLYIVLLAAWKAHKVYVPLDPTLPLERLQYMIQVVGAGTLVTHDTSLAVPLPRYTLAQLRQDSAWLPTVPRLDVPSYILFTSGSTGKPKGVQVSHRALAAALLSWERLLPHTRASRLLQLASPGFDVSLFEVCLPLGLGFSVATAPKDVLLTDLEAAFRALRITMADLPAALAALVHPDHVPPLEWLMSGGDVIDERVVRAWGAPPHRLINAYGPTEGTIGNTLGFVDGQTRRSVVGDVYPATALYICGRDSFTAAYTGAVGEIVVGGPQVADGYVGAPDLTAAKFFTLPNGQRVYRTGDRGRLLADGRVECLGRMERGQVKVNGQRVELDEIAHELQLEAGVADACVQYLQHPAHASRQLVAFLALDQSRTLSDDVGVRTDAEARAYAQRVVHGAQRRLAPFMVPAHTLVLTSALPLTPNNKVDVKRLAGMYQAMDPQRLHDAGNAPSTRRSSATETALMQHLAAFLQVPVADVDRDASFYALGIDSLSAIRLVKVLRLHGMSLTVGELLAHATPARLAAALDEAGGSSDDMHAYEALRASAAAYVPNALPCTPLQSGMLAQSTASEGDLYIHTHVFRVDCSVDALVKAWATVVQQHAMLRTSFHAHSSREVPWVQVVHDERTPPVVVHGPNCLDRVLPSARAACDPEHPHTLHVFSDELGVVGLWVLHHALYDAHGLELLWDDVDAALDGAGSDPRPPFSTCVPHLCSGEAHVPFWLDTLRGYTPRPLAEHTSHAAISCVIDTHIQTRDAEDMCRRVGVSMHTLATLAFAYLLAECMHTPDVCFGQVLSLRTDMHDAVDVLGPMLNTTPTRVLLQRAPFDVQLQQLQCAIDAARPHRHASLRSIAAAHQRTHASTAPLLDALLDVQLHTETSSRAHLQPMELSIEDGVQYALNVEFQQRPSTLVLSATARTTLADAARLDELLHRMSAIVRHMATDPHAMRTVEHVDLPPRNSTDLSVPSDILHRVRSVMATVAGVPAIDIQAHTPLLALGLDSMAAIQIVARARMQGLPLHVSDLAGGTPMTVAASFLHRTQTQMDDVRVTAPVSVAEAAAALGRDDVQAVRRVTAGQAQHIATLVHSRYRNGIFSLVYRASDTLDVGRLELAWIRLQESHEVLRTVFSCLQSHLVQVVVKGTQPMHTHVVPHADEGVKQVVHRERTWSLPTPWCAMDVVRALHGTDHVVLTLFHGMYDAVALGMLVRDLEALYRATDIHVTANMDDLLTVAARTDKQAVQRHWASYSYAPPSFVGTLDAPPLPTYTFVHRRHVVPRLGHIRSTLAEQHVSLSSGIIAAWASVLHDTLRTDMPVLGLYQAARSIPPLDLSTAALPCLNVLPMVVPWHADTKDMAKHVQKTLAERVPLEQVSLGDIHQALAMPASARFNTLLNVLGPSPPASTPSLLTPCSDVDDDRLIAPPPLCAFSSLETWEGLEPYSAASIAVDAYADNDTLSLALRCPAHVLSYETACALLDAFTAYVHAI